MLREMVTEAVEKSDEFRDPEQYHPEFSAMMEFSISALSDMIAASSHLHLLSIYNVANVSGELKC